MKIHENSELGKSRLWDSKKGGFDSKRVRAGLHLPFKRPKNSSQVSNTIDTRFIHLRFPTIPLLLVPPPFPLLRHNMRGRHRTDLTPLTLFVIAGTEDASVFISKVVQLPVEFAAPAALPVHRRCCGSLYSGVEDEGCEIGRWTIGWRGDCFVGCR